LCGPWIHPGSHFDPDAITQARMRPGYADCFVDISCLDKIQCDHGLFVTLVLCILPESITLFTEDAGLEITTLLDLLECPAPYFFSPLFLLIVGKTCGSLPENENERFACGRIIDSVRQRQSVINSVSVSAGRQNKKIRAARFWGDFKLPSLWRWAP
jgi:hypothetical protein